MKAIKYQSYTLSIREVILYSFEGVGIAALLAYVFYRSIVAFLIFLPIAWLFLKNKKRELANQRKSELNLQFREAIMSVRAALGAGYSIENAFISAIPDLEVLYGKKGYIVTEFQLLERRLKTNETLEHILEDFAERSGVADIRDFTEVFVVAKRSGGDLNAIIRKAASDISAKIEVKREIDTIISAKKMEQNIMNLIPFLIIFYMEVSSPGFLSVLYHNVLGVVIMTFSLLLYISAFLLSKRMIHIEV